MSQPKRWSERESNGRLSAHPTTAPHLTDMVFPVSDRIVFEQNPLEEVICQLRFPTILSISTNPAEFQEQIRESYPLYEAEPNAGLLQDFAVKLRDLGSGVPANLLGSVTHKFRPEDQQSSISLTNDFVAFSTNSYVTWEQFVAEVECAKAALENIYPPAFYTRVGLRYRNRIDREQLGLADRRWDDLIIPELVGPLAQADIQTGLNKYRAEALIDLTEVDNANVMVRFGLESNHIFFIDADFYVPEKADANRVRPILDTFNRLDGYFFRWAILGPLREALG